MSNNNKHFILYFIPCVYGPHISLIELGAGLEGIVFENALVGGGIVIQMHL